MSPLVCCAGPERETALEEFYQQWKDDSLVMLKWIALQVIWQPAQLIVKSGDVASLRVPKSKFLLCSHRVQR